MKPLLMMRTKGLTGPAFAKHAGKFSGLSKSAGNTIALGSSVVPDITGLTAGAAESALDSAGLTGSAIGTVDPVVSQNPAAGSSVVTGSNVAYTLSG